MIKKYLRIKLLSTEMPPLSKFNKKWTSATTERLVVRGEAIMSNFDDKITAWEELLDTRDTGPGNTHKEDALQDLRTWFDNWLRTFQATFGTEKGDTTYAQHSELLDMCIDNLRKSGKRPRYRRLLENFVRQVAVELSDLPVTPKLEPRKIKIAKEWEHLKERIRGPMIPHIVGFYKRMVPSSAGQNRHKNWEDRVRKHGHKFVNQMDNATRRLEQWLYTVNIEEMKHVTGILRARINVELSKRTDGGRDHSA